LNPIVIDGFAQGTQLHVKYFDKENRNFSKEINSILDDFNKSLSVYDSASVISKINRNELDQTSDNYFLVCFRKSMEISEKTNGAFDITVAPLVNAWNFGAKKTKHIDSVDVDRLNIDSLKGLVGYKKIKEVNGKITKETPEMKLDANAIAQGYAVDVISDFLLENDIKDFIVEIGGEVRASGTKPGGAKWSVGIDKPLDNSGYENRQTQAILSLTDVSIATSGNYRQFYEKDGIRYSHTIDPATGYPVKHNLLSATVMIADCMSADAYATAFMVLGLEKTREFVKNHKGIEVYLIYSEKSKNEVFMTDGIKKMLKQE